MLDIDSTAMHVLKEIMHELNDNSVQLYFACMKGPIRDAFKRCGVVGEVYFGSIKAVFLLIRPEMCTAAL